jgi:hypothetical protein
VIAALLVLYMAREAHINGGRLAGYNGFGSDFRGTVWEPDRAVLHGLSPYASSDTLPSVPAVYLPPIYLVTLPLGWLSLHAATWVWFGILVALGLGSLAVLDVRDPWCYALMLLSLPVVAALVLGNASILLGFLVALGWRWRDRRLLGPLAVAAAVALKSWLWPLLVWVLIRRVRSGLLSGVILGALVLVSWAAIGFHGLLRYPGLLHEEVSKFVRGGTLFVSALAQLNVPVKVAAVAGALGAVVLLALSARRRSNEVEAFSLALLAALVATPVGWPHYLILIGIPIAIAWPSLSAAWLWFPALWLTLWLTDHLTLEQWRQVSGSVALCALATLPVVFVAVRSRQPCERSAEPGEPLDLTRERDRCPATRQVRRSGYRG